MNPYEASITGIVLRVIAYVVLAPLAGGLLAGLDRKVSAWMQGRVGPPVIQPFYDVAKLLRKERIAVNRFQNFFVFLFFLFIIFTGSVFFAGASLLIVVFVLVLAGLFFVLAGFSVNSPYSHVGAERELIQMMAYDPAIIILAIGFYIVTGSFDVGSIYQASREGYLIAYLPGIFAAYLYILTIKFRKSPFDLSISHHAHQELVRGLTTEFSGPYLALIEVAHWYENILLLALIYLFFAFNPLIGVGVALVAYFAEIFADNVFARVKWDVMFASTWVFTTLAGVSNLVIVHYVLGR
ncbi:MAG: NADH-quinone oxidoreductase subunit H [Candidatus Hydrogenedentota bacterium]|nr:MAG: NADH-quinone oxidoreductase subunit H [Candidatus Hydrogenedentota bacterium]